MLLSQIKNNHGKLKLVAREGTEAYIISGVSTVYELAEKCLKNHLSLSQQIGMLEFEQAVDLQHLFSKNQVMTPLLMPQANQVHLALIAANQTANLSHQTLNDQQKLPKIAEINMAAPDGSLLHIGHCLAYILPDKMPTDCALQTMSETLSLGPEILIGDLPDGLLATAKIYKNNQILEQKSILLDDEIEALANSIIANKMAQTGDVLINLHCPMAQYWGEISPHQPSLYAGLEIAEFGLPLVNPWRIHAAHLTHAK